MLTTRVTRESRSVYICKVHGEKIENTFDLLQVGEDRENTKKMKTINLNNTKQNNAKHNDKGFVRGKNSTHSV